MSPELYYKEIIASVRDNQNAPREISIIPEIFINIISKLNVIDTLQCSLVNKAWINWICYGSTIGILKGIKEIQKSNVEIKALQEEIKKTKYSWFRETVTYFNADFALSLFKPLTFCAVPIVPLSILEIFLSETDSYQMALDKFKVISVVLVGGAIASGITYKIFSNLHQKEKAKETNYNLFMNQIKTIKRKHNTHPF